MVIILFIFLIFWAACKGDFSGVVLSGKIILIIGIVLVSGLILTNPILLTATIIIGAVALSVYLISHKGKPNTKPNTFSNNQQSLPETNSNEFIKDESVQDVSHDTIQTDFHLQLEKATKTPEQIHNEVLNKERQIITNNVQKDFEIIKQELLNKASQGQYLETNNTKRITIDYTSSYINKYVKYKKTPVYTYRLLSTPHEIRTGDKVIFYISNQEFYDLYLSKLQELATKENISIIPVLRASKYSRDTDKYHLPCEIQKLIVDVGYYKFVLNCTVSY